MEQSFRSEDIHLRETKVIANVLVFWLIENPRESHRVDTVLVNTRIQACKINIGNLLVFCHFGVQGRSASSTPKKRVSRLKRWNEFKVFQEFGELGISFFLSGEVAPPHFSHGVPCVTEDGRFLQGCLIHFTHGSIGMAEALYVSLLWITFTASVKNATLVLVHSIAGCVIAIHVVRLG